MRKYISHTEKFLQLYIHYTYYILYYNIDVNRISDNVAGMMYRPTSSGLLVPTSYQFGSNQIFQVKIAFIFYRLFIYFLLCIRKH